MLIGGTWFLITTTGIVSHIKLFVLLEKYMSIM